MIESFIGESDIGLVRLNNEDVWAYLPEEQFFILADGMGGHQAGEIAANEAVLYLCQLIKKSHVNSHTIEQWQDIVREGIQKANTWVFNLAAKSKETIGMGTTLCLALLTEKTLIYAHVGDSRIYRIRKNRITQLTRDHSLKDELIAQGKLDEDKAMNFLYRNVITRAIGTQKNVLPDISTCVVESQDIYLLCSDGLTDRLNNQQILNMILQASTLQEASEDLILQAKKLGSEDNITALLLKIA